MLTIRVTPDTSTRARCWLRPRSLELPRNAQTHGRSRLLLVLDREDLDPDVDFGLHLEQQHLGWLHPELPDVEAGAPVRRMVRSSTAADVHPVLVPARHTSERDLAAHAVGGRRTHRASICSSSPSILGNRRASMRFCISLSSMRLPDYRRSTASETVPLA